MPGFSFSESSFFDYFGHGNIFCRHAHHGPTKDTIKKEGFILSTVEPVITLLIALLGEALSWFQCFGAALVLSGAVWVISQSRPESN